MTDTQFPAGQSTVTVAHQGPGPKHDTRGALRIQRVVPAKGFVGFESPEIVCIAWHGAPPLSLYGWQVRDKESRDIYTFGEITLAPGDVLRLHNAGGTARDTATDVYWRDAHHTWCKEGQVIHLLDPDGIVHAQYVVTSGEANPSATSAGLTAEIDSAVNARLEALIDQAHRAQDRLEALLDAVHQQAFLTRTDPQQALSASADGQPRPLAVAGQQSADEACEASQEQHLGSSVRPYIRLTLRRLLLRPAVVFPLLAFVFGSSLATFATNLFFLQDAAMQSVSPDATGPGAEVPPAAIATLLQRQAEGENADQDAAQEELSQLQRLLNTLSEQLSATTDNAQASQGSSLSDSLESNLPPFKRPQPSSK